MLETSESDVSLSDSDYEPPQKVDSTDSIFDTYNAGYSDLRKNKFGRASLGSLGSIFVLKR